MGTSNGPIIADSLSKLGSTKQGITTLPHHPTAPIFSVEGQEMVAIFGIRSFSCVNYKVIRKKYILFFGN
jgi:hypothetical protein